MNTQILSRPTSASLANRKRFWSRDLVSIRDFSSAELQTILQLATRMKAHPGDFRGALAGKQLVMFFEKPSLRTRLTFESGMASLGGQSFFVDQTASRIDSRETLSDVAHNLERWIDLIVLRTFAHATVEKMAEYASVPVINALSEVEHPCQALTDYFTLLEKFGTVENLKLAFVGDGNNVLHSLLLTCAALGSSICVANPPGYEPDSHILRQAQEIAASTGASIQLFTDPVEAVTGADAIYTDTWTSMGHEQEAQERNKVFASYQVNQKLMAHAAPHAVFMHCLPAHRGEEVTDTVIDSPQSVVFDQAENRMHVQKAILFLLLGGGTSRLPVRSAHA